MSCRASTQRFQIGTSFAKDRSSAIASVYATTYYHASTLSPAMRGKLFVSRVAMPWPCARAVAAIMRSSIGSLFPEAMSDASKGASTRAALSSKARIGISRMKRSACASRAARLAGVFAR